MYFIIPEVIANIFIPIAELLIKTGTQTNRANAETETEPAEARINKFSAKLKYLPV